MSNNDTVTVEAQDQMSILEQLLTSRKGNKKGPTRLETKQFIDAWVGCAKKNCVNDKLVKLLYDGFQFACGAPFYRYVFETRDRDAYEALFSSKHTKENERGIALMVAINLFALEIGGPILEESPRIVAHAIPPLSISREGKTFGNLNRSIHRILVAPLARKRINENVTINERDASAIFSVLKDPLEEYAKNPKRRSIENDAVIGLLAWLKKQANPSSSVQSDTEGKSIQSSESSQLQAEADEEMQSADAGPQANTKNSSLDIGVVIEFLAQYRTEYELLVQTNDRLAKSNCDLESRATEAESRLENARQKCDMLSKQLASYSDRCVTLQQEVTSLTEEKKSIKEELTATQEMLLALDRRDSRQVDESAKRLASELRVEYRDYVDAADLPMDADLGENMREQLKNIFAILSNNGIEL